MTTSNTFSILFWLNKAKVKNDLCPIYARITVNGTRSELSIKRKISSFNWDAKAQCSKQRKHEGRILNNYLDKVYSKLVKTYDVLIDEELPVTAEIVKSRYLGKDKTSWTLLELSNYHEEVMKTILTKGTMKNYRTTERYIKRFLLADLKRDDIYLKQISYNFIMRFESHLRTTPPLNEKQPLNNNGIMKHMERLKKLLNLAVKLEWMNKEPFKNYEFKFEGTEKDFLSDSELEKLEKTKFKRQSLQCTKDMFIFACYTGLSYIDVKTLSDKQISLGIDGNPWIFSKRNKTSKLIKIPLLKKALQILEKYQNHPLVSEEKLLPIYSNQKINKYLKEITEQLKITKNITYHSARHTFATTITLTNGVSIETVSKLLGHSKLSTTRLYARVLDEKISSEMQNLKDVLHLKSKKEFS